MNTLPRLLPYFLTAAETSALFSIALLDGTFEPGRQGTGYEKAVFSGRYEALRGLRDRGLRMLGASAVEHDCYLLRYPHGSYIPPHVDPAPAGMEHWRLNAIVQEPDRGGDLYIGGIQYFLQQTDAVRFRSDTMIHEVPLVEGRDRLVWSLGALIPAR